MDSFGNGGRDDARIHFVPFESTASKAAIQNKWAFQSDSRPSDEDDSSTVPQCLRK